MSNSKLIQYRCISPNHNYPRTMKIDRITPHCVVGQSSIETLGRLFKSESSQTSSNYGIGADGRIGMYVEEVCRSWCSSSGDNDHRAITIECASESKAPYAMNDCVYQSLIDLCVDICRRNGKKKLLWLADREKTLAYTPASDEMVITVHRWFANKECPGEWLYSRLGELAKEVTARLEEDATKTLYRVQVGAFTVKENAEAMVERLKEVDFNGYIVKGTIKVDEG